MLIDRHEATVPIVIGAFHPFRIFEVQSLALQILVVNVSAHMDMCVGDVRNLQRAGAATLDEQRVKNSVRACRMPITEE